MSELLANVNPWVFALAIFIVRVVNIALDTLRLLTVMRQMRGLTWVLGFLQTSLWVLVLGSVMNDLNNPLNIIAYSTGYATGNVIGMMIEKRLAFGYINITVISSTCGHEIANRLREDGHAVTEIPAHGKDGSVEILECSIQRKFAQDVQDLIRDIDPTAFITSRDIQRVRRGFWRE
jgi:uncharacterized protein YebE (UPF0316 family)